MVDLIERNQLFPVRTAIFRLGGARNTHTPHAAFSEEGLVVRFATNLGNCSQ